jgi:hypothetical protein
MPEKKYFSRNNLYSKDNNPGLINLSPSRETIKGKPVLITSPGIPS